VPTYDYRCEKGHVFELFHSMKDEEPKHCPKCGTLAKRVPGGGSGFLFKGSGFYITDYRSKSYKEGAKGDKGGSGGGGEGGSGSSGSGGGSSSGGSGA
jgi:putative FmdB family regulatory protein